MHSLIYEYQALNSQKEILSEKLDNIEDQFIRDETPLYKQRMLGVYKRMAPLKAPMLEFILKDISYGPVKIASLPLIDGGYQRFGSLLYYKYKDPQTVFETPVLLFTYEGKAGKSVTRLYGLVLHGHLTAPISDSMPTYWMDGIGKITSPTYQAIVEQTLTCGISSLAPPYRLIAFLSADRDLGEFGDLYGAIPEYYDMQEKLRTSTPYYWTAASEEACPLKPCLEDMASMFTSKTPQTVSANEWAHAGAAIQKMLGALCLSKEIG
jgi:hypothetical protein